MSILLCLVLVPYFVFLGFMELIKQIKTSSALTVLGVTFWVGKESIKD